MGMIVVGGLKFPVVEQRTVGVSGLRFYYLDWSCSQKVLCSFVTHRDFTWKNGRKIFSVNIFRHCSDYHRSKRLQ